MKNFSIIYLIVLFFIASHSLGGYNILFAQQDSNKVLEETNKLQESFHTDKNIEGSTLTDLTQETGIEKIRNLFNFEKILASLFVILAGFFLLKIITRTLHFFAEKSTRYSMSYKGSIPIIRLLGWLIIIYLIIAVIIKLPFEILIAVSASLAIAIGLGAQHLVKNVIGGIMIIYDKPFQVGDKIKVGDHYGEVITIGLRFTRIVTEDDSTVSIPNSNIMNKTVSNSNSGEPNCQVVAEVYLPIDINTVAVREIALEVARVSKYVYLNKPISVLFFNEVKENRSFLKMQLKAYVMDIRYEFAFKSEITELIIRELLNEGVLKKEDVS